MKTFLSSLTTFVLVSLAFGGLALSKDPKLSVTEIVNRHLDSIGALTHPSPIARAAEGRARMRLLHGSSSAILSGTATFLSDRGKLRFATKFEHPGYTGDDLAFDGKETEAGFTQPGAYSKVGNFLDANDQILKEGLFGGVLSTSWPLSDLKGKQPNLDYEGLRKVDGNELHEVKYRPKRGGGDLYVRLYFDPETFQHAMTVYRLVLSAPMRTSLEEMARQQETRYTLEERFSNFEQVDGLNLPTRWTLRFTVDHQSTTTWEWDVVLEKVAHPESLDSGLFRLH